MISFSRFAQKSPVSQRRFFFANAVDFKLGADLKFGPSTAARSGLKFQRRFFVSFLIQKAATVGRLGRTVALVGGGSAAGLTAYAKQRAQDWQDWLDRWTTFPTASRSKEAEHHPSSVLMDPNNEESQEEVAVREPDSQWMDLTRQMLHVRQLLSQLEPSSEGASGLGNRPGLSLPTLVVVGSQSSGKTSLVEALVGQQFLPKGDNMVTRRPIEITLIHTPETKQEYVDFPNQQLMHITDFARVRALIEDLNQQTPPNTISSLPIQVHVHSPHVPNLQLIDLPGYIATTSVHQADDLKQQIQQVCDQYILPSNNIILAVCAADVDLANSEALNAARRVDPLGERTVGVVTKMDLVDVQRAVGLLKNDAYPLKLGYCGVITKSQGSSGDSSVTASDKETKSRIILAKNKEDKYFGQHEAFRHVMTGTRALRLYLTQLLGRRLLMALHDVQKAVDEEQRAVDYKFKVEYNDKWMTAEAYAREWIEKWKADFRTQIMEKFNRDRLRLIVSGQLNELVTDICNTVYWNENNTQEQLESHSEQLLSRAYSMLTQSHIGHNSTQNLMDRMIEVHSELTHQHVNVSSLRGPHAESETLLHEQFVQYLNEKEALVREWIENALKPWKFIGISREWTMAFDSLEGSGMNPSTNRGTFSSNEAWRRAWASSRTSMVRQIKQYDTELEQIHKEIGKRRLKSWLFLRQQQKSRSQQSGSMKEGVDFSVIPEQAIPLLDKYEKIQKRRNYLRERLKLYPDMQSWINYFDRVLRTGYAPLGGEHRQLCAPTLFYGTRLNPDLFKESVDIGKSNPTQNPHINYCLSMFPEPYLHHLVQPLSQICATYLYSELLHDFYRDMLVFSDSVVLKTMQRRQYSESSRQSTEDSEALTIQRGNTEDLFELWARDNPEMAKRLDLQRRRRVLERVKQVLDLLVVEYGNTYQANKE